MLPLAAAHVSGDTAEFVLDLQRQQMRCFHAYIHRTLYCMCLDQALQVLGGREVGANSLYMFIAPFSSILTLYISDRAACRCQICWFK